MIGKSNREVILGSAPAHPLSDPAADESKSSRDIGDSAAHWTVPEELAQFEASGNSAFVAELVACFLGDAEERVQLLRQAAGSTDLATLASQFHALKGSASSIGVTEIAALSCDAEEQARSGVRADYSAVLASIEGVLSRVHPLMIAYCASVTQACESGRN